MENVADFDFFPYENERNEILPYCHVLITLLKNRCLYYMTPLATSPLLPVYSVLY